jgi:hypothetical protein
MTLFAVAVAISIALPTPQTNSTEPVDKVGYSVDELGPNALPGPLLYVALGDSYSAGEGEPLGDPGWLGDTGEDGCHRSAHAYGPRVWGALDRRDPSWGIQFRPCSGAQLVALWTDFKGNPPQFDAFSRGPADLVTIGFGGNDIGFGDIVYDCVRESFGDRYLDGVAERVWERLPGVDPDECARRWRTRVDEALPTVRANLRAAYGQIIDPSFLNEPPRLKPGGKIMAIGYPRPFPDDPSGSCSLGTMSSVGVGTMNWINQSVVDPLNAVIREEAQRAGVHFVDTSDYFTRFGRHDFCVDDGSERWITRIIPTEKQRSVHPKFGYYERVSEAILACWDNSGIDARTETC